MRDVIQNQTSTDFRFREVGISAVSVKLARFMSHTYVVM